jgi:nucleotide-binding universal stress UspA family protein
VTRAPRGCQDQGVYTQIVVGTDGSETAGVAVHHAAQLAKLSGATLHIVHAYRPVGVGEAAIVASSGAMSIDVTGINNGIADNAAQVCAHAASAVERGDVKVETHAVPGEPSDALLTVAHDVGADLLVVGNRGMSGARRFVLGSVPNKISHHAPCSVLIVDTTH